MSREFKSTQIASASTANPEVSNDALDILARAETKFRGQVADDPDRHATATKDWLADQPSELGGPAGPEPTRFGDWERNGRCFDF